MQLLLEFPQVSGSSHFTTVGSAENKIAKSEVGQNELPQLMKKERGSFEQKRNSHCACALFKFRVARLEQNGDILVLLFDGLGKMYSSFRIFLPVVKEIDVRNHPEDCVLVFFIKLPCIFIRCAEQYLRACTQSQELVREADSLQHQPLGKVEDFRIDDWKIR